MSKKDKWLDNDGLDAQVAALLAERNTLKEKVAELVVERTRLRVKVGKLTAERDRWMSNAYGAQKLSLEYLLERVIHREALEDFLRDWDNGPVDRGTEGKLVDIAAKHADAFRDVLNREE